MIKGTIVAKFQELSEGTIPVCLFPTRKACEKYNLEMLNNIFIKYLVLMKLMKHYVHIDGVKKVY